MSKMSNFLSTLMSGKISIVVYLAMFVYLVILPLIAFIPGLSDLMPSTTAMLVGDNYTSVLAALGASIAAGAGVTVHHKLKDASDKHDELANSVAELHKKIDKLSQK